MSFPRYLKYKDSGVEWLGEVPEHWHITPVKHLASLKGRLGWQGLRADEYTDDGPFLVTSEHFADDRIDWNRCHHVSVERYQQAPEIQLRSDDLLMMKDGAAMGKLAYVDEVPGPACLNSHLLLFRPLTGKFENRFLYYVLAGPVFYTYMLRERRGTTFFGISQESIGNFPFVVPPIDEQRRILRFLNHEIAKIDALVAEQRRLMELLKEKRQAVISHAVSKGLNPEAPMKASGIEWLGDVPEHWTCCRNKALFVEVDQRSVCDEGELMTVSHITGVTPRSEKNVNMFLAETLEGYKQCRRGDLVINTMWAWMGALGCTPCDGLVSPSYNVYRPRRADALWQDYYDRLCRIPSHIVAMKANSSGVWESRLRLYPDAFLDMRMALPPRREQMAIAEYLDAETAKWDALTSETQRAIDLLQERRTALISAAVTGQIDVRGVAQPAAA